MNAQIFKVVAKIAVPAFLAAFAVPAFAVDVTFSTAGYFCSTGTCSSSNGSTSATFSNAGTTVTISDTGLTNKTVVLGPPAFVSALTFTATANNINNQVNTTDNFSLVVSQSVPSVPDYTDSAVLTGTISFAGGPTLTFNQNTFTLGGIVYLLGLNSNNGFVIGNPGGATNGVSTLNMEVTPEPAFYGLTGLAFAGLIGLARRRKHNQAIG